MEAPTNLPTENTSITQVPQAPATGPAVIRKDTHSIPECTFPWECGEGMARAELPSSFGQDLGGCVSQAELLCPHPGLSIASKEARSQGCAKGEEKQGNARVRLCHGRCPTGALRKYLRKLLAGLGRWVRAGDSVLIALSGQSSFFGPSWS